MRWFWIDHFTEFESGRQATAVKNVSLAEDHLHDHFPGLPVMPHSLILEGMAQTAGLLVAETSHFDARIVLAKVAKARFHGLVRPGDRLVYRAVAQDLSHDGGVVVCQCHNGARLQADAELFFANLGQQQAGRSLFEPVEFLAMLRVLRVFEVGRQPDGAPLTEPAWMRDAETARAAETTRA